MVIFGFCKVLCLLLVNGFNTVKEFINKKLKVMLPDLSANFITDCSLVFPNIIFRPLGWHFKTQCQSMWLIDNAKIPDKLKICLSLPKEAERQQPLY